MIPLPQALSLPIRHVGIGVFDGLHRGHQEILATVLRQTASPHEAAILTFNPHPLEIIAPEKAPLRLSSLNRMEYWIHHYGIPHLLSIPFDDKIRHFSPNEFVIYLKRYLPSLESLTVGFNWRFGFNGLGSTLTLVDLGSQLGFSTHIVSPISMDGETISSTRIRELVFQKKFTEAEKLLGHPFEVEGTISSGDGKGRSIGFPTANMICERQLLPPYGTYASRATIDGKSYRAVTNHGLRPTFNKTIPQLESHLLDFSGDLYGKRILLDQWHWLRDEKKFPDLNALQSQIALDIQTAERL